MRVSENRLEQEIVSTLLYGPTNTQGQGARRLRYRPPGYGEFVPGGYYNRAPEDYDRARCLIPKDALDFIYATQPEEWERFKQQHGVNAREQFFQRFAHELTNRGTLEVLRKGIKANGCKLQLAYFHPASGLNPALQKLHQANIFSVVRQLRYSQKNESSLDLVLFLNGLPILTVELKNPLTGQNVEDAIRQYRTTRDPREPLFAFGRCLAHFAVDPDLVYVTTHLQGAKTEFLPFNQGYGTGAGNPPSWEGFATAYLWERIWSRDSILNLVQYFVHIVDVLDDDGRKTGEWELIFPRYHQLATMRTFRLHPCRNTRFRMGQTV